MSQSPPLNAMQTLENQQSIHKFNIESFERVLLIIELAEDASGDLIDCYEQAAKELFYYIIFGSNERYNKARNAIELLVENFYTFKK